MNFLFLILAAFLGGFGLGYVKFFVLGYLCDQIYTLADKDWIIQAVGALITAGPCLVFPFSAPLASAYRKGRIMFWAGAVSALCLIFGALTNWWGSHWIYVFLVGLSMGVFNPAKNAAIPLEAAQSGRTTEMINASLNIVYIAGLLAGIPLGAWVYDVHPTAGAALAVVIFFGAGLSGSRCSYLREAAHLHDFKTSFTDLIKTSSALLRHYLIYLLASPLIWGIAGALSLAITAFAEQRALGGAVACSFMSVYAAVGVALGNALTPKLRHVRYTAAAGSSLGMLVATLAIPMIVVLMQSGENPVPNHTIYIVVTGAMIVLGTFFGIATNLLESEYLSLVYQEGKEGAGAALLSALTAFFPFTLGGVMGLAIFRNWVSGVTQFYWLAGVSGVAAVLILKLAWEKRGHQLCG